MSENATGTEWVIAELFGHFRTAGRASEVERYGGKMMRLDIPDGEGSFVTQFLGHASLYRVTLCTEAAARWVAARSRPEPVSLWEMSALVSVLPVSESDEVDAPF